MAAEKRDGGVEPHAKERERVVEKGSFLISPRSIVEVTRAAMNIRPRKPFYLDRKRYKTFSEPRLSPEEAAYRDDRRRTRDLNALAAGKPRLPRLRWRWVTLWSIRVNDGAGQPVAHKFPRPCDARSEEIRAVLVAHGLPADELERAMRSRRKTRAATLQEREYRQARRGWPGRY